mgnify:CR=1 FL=1
MVQSSIIYVIILIVKQTFQIMVKYQVIFKNDKSIIGTYSTRKRASNKVNKLDNAYGAYAYTIQTIEVA